MIAGVRLSAIAAWFFCVVLFSTLTTGCDRPGIHAGSGADSPQLASNAEDQAALIHQGKLIFDETPKYASQYVGGRLACTDCHIGSGTVAYAAPMIDMAGLFPMFNKRAGHILSLQNRIQECFSRSESGRPPPLDSPQMKSLVAYIDYLSKDQLQGQPYQGRGLVKLPSLTGDPGHGKAVYSIQCAQCHAADGAGVLPMFPAVWGPKSFNDGASMNNPAIMAAFVAHNMPENHPGTLKPQDAYDVSEYIHTMPRPQFNEAYKNY
jgi:thiosulfate dehydrogenase